MLSQMDSHVNGGAEPKYAEPVFTGHAEQWAEASPDTGEGVEQVRRRVAPVVQHLVEGEDVVVDAVVGEVGVFDAAERHRPLGLDQLLRAQDLQETQSGFHP